MPDLGQKTRGRDCCVFFYPTLESMLTDPNLLSSRSLEKAIAVQGLTQSLKLFVSFFIYLYHSLFVLILSLGLFLSLLISSLLLLPGVHVALYYFML